MLSVPGLLIAFFVFLLLKILSPEDRVLFMNALTIVFWFNLVPLAKHVLDVLENIFSKKEGSTKA